MLLHHVYWYHLAGHTDPYSQGYIGVTCQPDIRERCHVNGRRGGSKVLHSAFKKYGTERIINDVLHTVEDAKQAYELEKQYRPIPRIGWNIAEGGGLPPDTTGRVDSPEVRAKRAKSVKEAWIGKQRTNKFKGTTGRYTEEQRKAIGDAHRGKTISEAHRQSAREKVSRDKSPLAKKVWLVHKDKPDLVHLFACIKAAAEALGITYNTLRSQAQRTLRDNKSSDPSRTGWICLSKEDAINPVSAVERVLSTRLARFARIVKDREEQRRAIKGSRVAPTINR